MGLLPLSTSCEVVIPEPARQPAEQSQAEPRLSRGHRSNQFRIHSLLRGGWLVFTFTRLGHQSSVKEKILSRLPAFPPVQSSVGLTIHGSA